MPESTTHGFQLTEMLKDAYHRGHERMQKTAEADEGEAEDKPKDKKDVPPFVKKDEGEEKSAELDYAYFDKLAGAVEYANDHLDEIVDGRSNEEKVAEALIVAELMGYEKTALKTDTKDAGNAPADLTPPMKPATGKGLQESPAPSNAMANTQEDAPGGAGEQPYKHDKAKTTTIPNETPLESPELAAGSSSTAMETDENQAPGGNSGSVPTAGYPDEGVFKEAQAALEAQGIPTRYARVMVKQAGPAEILQAIQGAGGKAVKAVNPLENLALRRELLEQAGEAGEMAGDMGRRGFGDEALAAITGQIPELQQQARREGAKAVGKGAGGVAGLGALGAGGASVLGGGQEVTASVRGRSPLVDFVLRKLAEDNSGAKPSAGKGGTTVDGGDFPGTEAGEGVPEKKTRGQDKMVGSNDAAIQYTKREAKAEPKKDMGKVLDEPAQSKATDSKLHENLGPVVDSAGAKIASDGTIEADAARELLRRVLAGDDGPEKEAALKQAMAKLADNPMDEVPPASDVEDPDEADRQQTERSEQQFADILESAARAEGEGTGEPVAPAAAPDVPATV